MEIDLFKGVYPETKRDTKKVGLTKTEEQIRIAKQYNWEYFDKKGICYNGYNYDGRWIATSKKFIDHYGLNLGDKILDVGCAKGYFVYDLRNLGMDAFGLDISEYAIGCSPPDIRKHLFKGNAKDLSNFHDKEFDLVISITTIHNLPEIDCRSAIREIERVGKKAWIKVDSYRNDKEKEEMLDWNLTAETILHRDDWIKLFEEEGYKGDYWWTLPGKGY